MVLLGLWLALLLGGCGKPKPDASPAPTPKLAPYQWLGRIEPEFLFSSTATGSKHTIRVYLPKGYPTSGRDYPVLYMTDAQWAFAFYAETLDWKHKEAILIGVDQGSAARRMLDFSSWGANDYLRFLKQELIPAIENKFRTNHERTYLGVSLGGLFGAVLLCDEPVGTPYFKNYLLFDGSFNFLTSQNIHSEEARFQASSSLDLQIILTGATPGNAPHASAFADRYQKRRYQMLKLTYKAYAIPHDGIAAPSFGDFVDVVYESK